MVAPGLPAWRYQNMESSLHARIRETLSRSSQLAEGGAIKESIDILRELLSKLDLVPQDLTVLRVRARVHLKIGSLLQNSGASEESFVSEFSDAIRVSSGGVSRYPDDPYLIETRGNALEYLHEYDAAIADYEKIIQCSPENPLGYYLRGRAMYKRAYLQDPIPLQGLVDAHSDIRRAIAISSEGMLADVCYWESAVIGCRLVEQGGVSSQLLREIIGDIREAGARIERRVGKATVAGRQRRRTLAGMLLSLRKRSGAR